MVDKRQEQNLFGVIIIFVAGYMFINRTADALTSGILLIFGFGVSKDARNLGIFVIKYLFSKLTKKPSPTYDFSNAEIKQSSRRDSVVNYGTMHVHNR